MTVHSGDQSGFPRAHVRDGEVVEETAFGPVHRAIFPEYLFRQMAEAYARTVDSAVVGGMGPQRVGHRLPVTSEQLAEFEAWKSDYETARGVGFARGWLIGGYEPDELDEPRGEWVWDESEEDFKARHAAWLAEVAPDGVIRIAKVGTDGAL